MTPQEKLTARPLTARPLTLVLLTVALGLALLATGATADDRVYTDAELATMPAPGPNPYLSFLPAEADVDWNYWRQKVAYESHLRAEAQNQGPSAALINLAEMEPNDSLATAQEVIGFGNGAGDDPEADVTGSIGGGDIDCFAVELEVGDILGVSQTGDPTRAEVYETGGELQMGSEQDASFLYPASSPMPGGGNVADFIAYATGEHYVCVSGGSGAYTLRLRSFRSVFETGGDRQTLFIDFDGATINPVIFDGPNEDRVLSPLSSFLAGWGLAPGDESTLIDSILASIEENLVTDLAMASNPNFDVEILNSRDHADPFGDPNVSRLIVGGTIAEFGISTIGIAETIDPGNFGTEESAVVLLDLLSAGAGNPNSLNQFGLGGGATIFDLVGTGVGVITAHEAGHYLGNWHTEQFDVSSDPSIMDQGGNLPNTVGVGPDNIFGTADDFDTDFSADEFNFNEGFDGIEHTDENTAFGLTGDGAIFTDGFESGDTSAWSTTVN